MLYTRRYVRIPSIYYRRLPASCTRYTQQFIPFLFFLRLPGPGPFLTSRQKTNEGGGRDHTTNDVAIGHAIFSQSTVYIFFFFLGRGRVCFLVPLDNRAREFWKKIQMRTRRGKDRKRKVRAHFRFLRSSEKRMTLAKKIVLCISSCNITQHTQIKGRRRKNHVKI